MRRLLSRSTIGSTALLLALYFVLFNRFGPEHFHGLVWRWRRPGQMSVVEALAMEMEAAKPPEGVLPVVTEVVKPLPFEIAVTYTGTVAPLNEELVVARVTGRLTWMPYYAGDRIRKGQLVAKLDNAGGEYAAREVEAAYGAMAALHERHMAEAEKEEAEAKRRRAESAVRAAQAMRDEAERMVAEKRAMLAEATNMATQAQASVAEAEQALRLAQAQLKEAERMVTALESERQVASEQVGEAEAELQRALQEVEIAQQELTAARSEFAYWEAEIERAKTLYEQKVISKDEFQREQAQYETARSRVQAGEAKVRQAQAMVRAAETRVRQAKTMVKQKEAELAAARERVAQAQAMVTIAQAKLAQMQAMAQAAQAKVQQAQAALEAAQARAQQAAAEVQQAQAMVQEAQAGIHRAQRHVLHADALRAQAEAALTVARIVRGYTEIRALTDGYVVERLVAPGTLVTAGTPILRIAQLDKVRVQAFVAEKDLADIRLGSPIVIQSVKDGKQWQAEVTAIFPSADPTTRTGLVEAIVDNTGLRLLPGQSVIVRLVKQRLPAALTVPNSAITQFNGQPAVWVAMPTEGTGPTEYTCPMGCIPPQDKPGKCPKCGMDLVPTKRHPMPAQTEYTCPMHPEVRSDKPGKCPKCGMDLVPTKRQDSGVKVAHLRTVHLGATDGQRTVVLHGLQEGEEVIVRGWQSLKEGTPVIAVKEGELPKALLTPPSPQGGGHQHGGH